MYRKQSLPTDIHFKLHLICHWWQKLCYPWVSFIDIAFSVLKMENWWQFPQNNYTSPTILPHHVQQVFRIHKWWPTWGLFHQNDMTQRQIFHDKTGMKNNFRFKETLISGKDLCRVSCCCHAPQTCVPVNMMTNWLTIFPLIVRGQASSITLLQCKESPSPTFTGQLIWQQR